LQSPLLSGNDLWADGHANQHCIYSPLTSACTWLRRTDLVSAAAALMERDLFLRLGGFNESYGRGYYEDADLAFRVRAAGREVYVQPLAAVYHAPGTSLGRNRAEQMRLIEGNRQRFMSVWAGALRDRALPGAPLARPLWASRYRLRVLVLPEALPPLAALGGSDSDSGSDARGPASSSRRLVSLLVALLGRGHHAALLPGGAGAGGSHAGAGEGAETGTGAGVRFPRLASRRVLEGRGVHVLPAASAASLRRLECAGRYDAVWASSLRALLAWGPHLADACGPGVPLVYEMDGEVGAGGPEEASSALLRWELKLARGAAVTLLPPGTGTEGGGGGGGGGANEVSAATASDSVRRLLEQGGLDPRRVRVGLVEWTGLAAEEVLRAAGCKG
jgi:hypothetical protein